MHRPALLAGLLLCLLLAALAWLLSVPSPEPRVPAPPPAPGAESKAGASAGREAADAALAVSPEERKAASKPSETNHEQKRVGVESPLADPEDPPLLTGLVLEADGSPAVGARVFARTGGWYSVIPIELEPSEGPGNGRQEAHTANDGRFEFREGLSPGSSLAVSVVHEEHATTRLLRIPFRSAPHDLGTIQLRRGMSLTGVVRTEDGAPLAGVDVLLAARRGVAGLEGSFPGQGSPAALTDEDGAFRVDSLAPGRWHLLFDAAGMQVAERSGEELLATTVALEDVVLRPGHTIAGTIVGVPPDRMSSLEVEARCEQIEPASLRRPRRARPDANGAFRIEGVAPHERVRVRVLTRSDGSGPLPAPEVAPVVVESETQDLRLPWGDPLTLRARVVDASGVPIENYSAFTQLGYFGGTHEIGGESPNETHTYHPGGELRAGGLRLYSEERTPLLIIHALGYEDHEREVEGLVPGEVVDLGDLSLTTAPLLTIHVHDPEGAPIAGAAITLEAEDRRTQETETGDDGIATLNAHSDTTSLLHVTHERWSGLRRRIPAAHGSEASVRIMLQQGCALTAQVRSPNGAGLEGHRIEATPLLPNLEPDPDAVVRKQGSDREGRVEWSGLRAGPWRIRRLQEPREWRDPVQEPGLGQIVTLTPDATTLVELLARPESPVTGVVRDSRGALPTATLRLRPLDHRGGKTKDRHGWLSKYNRLSDVFGEFRFDRIPHGQYQLEIEHDRRAMVALWNLSVSETLEPLDIELPSASFRVRVVDDNGRPVPGVTVELDGGDARYRGWNDGRRAWTDERGDLQQAWYQDAVHQRQSREDGWTHFDGCVPDVPVTLSLIGRWTTAASVTVAAPRAGEMSTATENLIWRPAGDVLIVPVGNSQTAWRVQWVPLGREGRAEQDLAHHEEGSSEPITFRNCRAGPGRLELELQGEGLEWEQAATIDVIVPARQVLTLEADLDLRAMAVR